MENMFNVELKQGEYFDCGNHYFVEFKYGSKEQQQKMYELFKQELIPSYGSHSDRAKAHKEFIMPYYADENGKMTPDDTGKFGGTSIPEDLLAEFIRRFVVADKAIVKVGEEEIRGTFDYDEFDKMKDKLGLRVELKQGEYFDCGYHYFVEFKYGSKEQQQKMYELFKQELIPSYGSHSSRAKAHKEFIMPYYADENGKMTPDDTGKFGGTSIPEDLLAEFIRRFVVADKAIVKVGEEEIRGNFDYDEFDRIISGNHIAK